MKTPVKEEVIVLAMGAAGSANPVQLHFSLKNDFPLALLVPCVAGGKNEAFGTGNGDCDSWPGCSQDGKV